MAKLHQTLDYDDNVISEIVKGCHLCEGVPTTAQRLSSTRRAELKNTFRKNIHQKSNTVVCLSSVCAEFIIIIIIINIQ